jgi:nicastrin
MMRARWSLILIAAVISSLAMTGCHGLESINSPFTHQSFSKLEHAPCVSLFTRNGRVGCGTASRSVELGKLVYYKNAAAAAANDQPTSTIVIVVEDYAWTAETITTMQNIAELAGILVLNSTSVNDEDQDGNNNAIMPSPDARTPQGYGTASASLNYGNTQYAWNAYGEGLLELNLHGIPVAYVSNVNVADSIRDESKKNDNVRRHEIVAEFNYYMGPAEINSFDCLGWKNAVGGEWAPTCLPLAGTSVWASLVPEDSSSSNSKLPVLLVAAGMDATSYFHDKSPGANTAASNILTILMAAKLVGQYCNIDDGGCRAKVQTNIVFALFQAETYGFVGSRTFLRDVAYPGFTCQSGDPVKTNPAKVDGDPSEDACLNPLRQSLRFANLGQISGMLAVDQVGHSVSSDMLYAHTEQDNNDGNNYGSNLATLLKAAQTDLVSVSSSSTADNGNGYPYPPSPLTSLLNLSGGTVGGCVLTGFDNVYTSKIPYHSHLDVAANINLDTIAAAATIVARTAVAAAVGGDSDYAVNLIPALASDDSHFQQLVHCFLYDGSCKLIRKYSTVEIANAKARTGMTNLQQGPGMETPPNYYVGVYNDYYGQPFVQVGDKQYGAYDGAEYGKKKTDAIALRPRQMEAAIRGLLNDYLGQYDDTNDDVTKNNKNTCSSAADCDGLNLCNSAAPVTCTGGGRCVCERAHYHVALDEALRPEVNKPPGFFSANNDDNNDNNQQQNADTPVYTEPFWSSTVGVRVYRKSGPIPGILTMVTGVAVAAISYFGAVVLKMGLKKEKLF